MPAGSVGVATPAENEWSPCRTRSMRSFVVGGALFSLFSLKVSLRWPFVSNWHRSSPMFAERSVTQRKLMQRLVFSSTQVEDMLKPSTRPASEASGVEQQPFVKRYKDHLVVVGSGGRQSPFEAPFAYAYAPSGQLVLGVPRESPPLLQEAPARAPHSKDGQPNVALLAPPRSAPARQPAAPDRAEPVPAPSNPEIELSSTDTDDSDSMHSQNGGESRRPGPVSPPLAHAASPLFLSLADGKSNWDLPAGLANQVNSVEDLLRRGGCDAPSSRLILQVTSSTGVRGASSSTKRVMIY